jgi:Ca2+:H+ antiporter
MFSLDAIRRQAHRVASSNNNDGTMNYNPFARTRSREQATDLENPHRTRSEAAATPYTIEEQRQLESQQGQQEFPAPHHAGTAPSAVSPTSGSTEKDFAHTNGHAGPSKESTDINGSTDVDHSTLSKRAKFKGVFRKSHEAPETHDLEHVDSDELSLEERKKRSLKKKIPVGQQFRAVILGSWINVLLVFVPVGFAMYYSKKVGPVPIFIVNFIAIIPLAAMLSYATEELAIRVGETLGGLLNATFGYVACI